MPIHIFDSQDFIAIIGTKEDGDFGFRTQSEDIRVARDRQSFLEKFNVRHISMMEPRGHAIAFNPTADLVHAHGIISDQKKVWGLRTSDCLPFIVLDEKNHRIGVLHLGWWQIYINLTSTFFNTWSEKFPGKNNLKLFIGPSICAKCFTFTGPKGWLRIILFYLSPLRKHLKKMEGKGSYIFDLKEALLEQLVSQGFSLSDITISHECTFENENLSSYRRERAGRKNSNFVVAGRI